MAILIYGLGVNAAGEFKHTMHNSENVHKRKCPTLTTWSNGHHYFIKNNLIYLILFYIT